MADWPEITPCHVEEARRLLGWTRFRIAARIGMGHVALQRAIEKGIFDRTVDVADVHALLEAAGVEFIVGDDGQTRVQLRAKPSPISAENSNASNT